MAEIELTSGKVIEAKNIKVDAYSIVAETVGYGEKTFGCTIVEEIR